MHKSPKPSRWQLSTQLVHAGERLPAVPGLPTVHPISMSNTYVAPPEVMDAILGGAPGYTYGRHHNPTVDALTHAMAALEEGEAALAYASGMAAIHAALTGMDLRPGDALLLSRDLYGASLNLVDQLFRPLGIQAATADLTDLAAAETALSELHPRALLFELISNPLLRILNGPALTELAHRYGARVIVDNTFTTPLLAQPLTYGADMVVHSATKYLGGHGDAIGGILVTRAEFYEPLHGQQKLLGTILGPFEAWLIHRGLKTLDLRFRRQCHNAGKLAAHLADSGRFLAVHYPALPSHPESSRLRTCFPTGEAGAVVTVELDGGKERVFRFLKALELVVPATTIGDVYTLALYPAMASHRSQSPAERQAMGITDGMVRIAVGIEAWEDIAQDILHAAST